MSRNILKISDAASIAIHAMVLLAQNKDQILSLKEISQKFGVSANHLSKIMQRLHKAGLILSIKGRNGGFKLINEPNEINFMQIYEIFDGTLTENNCLLTHVGCKSNCIFGDLINSINAQVKEKFNKTFLSEFVK
ncbi:Rrf2 family transcriptional regulator [bacterium]|nr:Rrf2 family transcriptional regulator [bacterium]